MTALPSSWPSSSVASISLVYTFTSLKSAPPTGIGGSGTSSILFALRPKNDAAHVRDDYSILSESRLVENREVRHIRVLI